MLRFGLVTYKDDDDDDERETGRLNNWAQTRYIGLSWWYGTVRATETPLARLSRVCVLVSFHFLFCPSLALVVAPSNLDVPVFPLSHRMIKSCTHHMAGAPLKYATS